MMGSMAEAQVIERRVVVPVDIRRLWEALTDPSEVDSWWGGTVEWNLEAGGSARWNSAGSGDRSGVILEVRPGRRLRWIWWPAEDDDSDPTEVTYELLPGPDDPAGSTELVVIERPTPASDVLASVWTAADSKAAARWAQASATSLVGV